MVGRLLVDAPEEIVGRALRVLPRGRGDRHDRELQASFDGFAARGIGRNDAERLMRRSVELAMAARDEVGGRRRWVAASVGPYGAALANGEEYVGRYGLSVAELADWHRPRLEILADAGADVLAMETVPDIDEAEALVGLVHELGVPAWLSYTIAGADDAGRAAAGRRVRRGRRRAGDRCGGRELLCTRRRRARDRGGPRGDGQARHRLPQQRRGVGRRAPNVDRQRPGGRRTWCRSGRPQAHASSAGAVGYAPTTSQRWRRLCAEGVAP